MDTIRWLIVSVALFGLVAAAPVRAQNLVANPSFEQAGDEREGLAEQWSLSYNSAGEITLALDPREPAHGSVSQRLEVPEGGCRHPRVQQRVRVQPDTQYEFSCRARSDNGLARIWVSEKTWGSEFVNRAVPGDGEWHEFSARFRSAAAGAVWVTFLIHNPERQADRIWIDDVSLRAVAAPEPMPTNLAADCAYELFTPRSYGSSSPGDRRILTDGQWQGGYWTRPNTLAWRLLETQRANVMIDLGRTHDIGAVAIGAVYGRSAHPPRVDVYLGADPDSLVHAGTWDPGEKLPVAPDGAATELYRGPELNAAGRFVLFSMTQDHGSLVCITELLVHPADSAVRALRGDALNLREFVEAQDPLRHIPPVSMEVETPHFKWAPTLRGNPPRVLTIIPYVCSRDAVELNQRIGANQRVFALRAQPDLMGYFPTQDLLAELELEPDVIVMGGVQWDQLRPEAAERLLQTIEQGAGLVWINPAGLDEATGDLLESLPLGRVRVLDGDTADLPYPLLDDLGAGSLGELRRGEHGQGSIATLRYETPNPNWPTWGSSLFPELPPGTNAPGDFAYWELYCSLLCKLVVQAAFGAPDATIEALSATVRADGMLEASVQLGGSAGAVKLRAEMRDEFNRLVARARRDATDRSVTLELPGHFQTGHHLVTVWAEGDNRTVLDWCSAMVDVPGPLIASIKLSSARYERGDAIEATVACEGLRPGLRLVAELIDGYGGLTAVDAAEAAEAVSVRLNSSLCRSLASRLWVRLLDGERIIDEKALLVPTIRDVELSDHTVGIWATYGSYVGKRHWGYSMVEVQAPLLVDMAIAGTPNAYAMYDMRPAPENMHRIFFKGSEAYEQMNLCAPGFREDFLTAVRDRVAGAYNWGAYDYSIGDECGYTLRTDDHTLAAFRAWLAGKYATIGRLNDEWLSRFTSWDEVSFEYVENRVDGTIAPGLDHRRFSDHVFIDTLAAARAEIEAVDARNRVGISGTREPAHYIGFDWWKLANAVTHLAIYDGLQREAIRSFKKPGDMLTSFVGYDYADGNEVAARYFPWLEAFSGFQGISIYSANSGEVGGVIRPDLTLTNRAEWMTEEVSQLKSGIAKALLSSERPRPPIAMLYSQRSIHAATMLGLPAVDNMTAISEIIKDIGLQYDFVSSEQLEQGIAPERGYRLMVLPLAVSLSGAEASALTGFVNAGGRLLAVGPCGILNEHGRVLGGGSLDVLFGARSGAVLPAPPLEGDTGFSMSDLSLDVCVADPGLRATDAARVVPFHSGASPALLTRESGSGRATMLNFVLSGYRQFRPSGVAGETVDRLSADARTGENYQRLLDRLIRGAGIEATIRLEDTTGDPVRHVELVEFRAGELRYVGILPRYFGGRYSQSLAPRPVVESESRPASLLLSEGGHVYDVRTGSYIGETDRIDVKLTTGIARLYAIAPYRVRGVSLEAVPEVRAGRMLSVDVRVEVQAGEPAPHVVRVEFARPGEEAIKPHRRNVTTLDGGAAVSFAVPLNAPTGRWRLTATEIISGKTATREINVRNVGDG